MIIPKLKFDLHVGAIYLSHYFPGGGCIQISIGRGGAAGSSTVNTHTHV